MTQQAATPLSDLYEADVTAWLDAMAELVRQGRYEEIDYSHREEYLGDMAKRERKIIESVIGGKLRSEAIQTLNMKSGSVPNNGSQKAI